MTSQLFHSAEQYYARYRPRYPAELLDYAMAATAGNHGHSLVDWGCGTGEITLRLARYFDRVTAVDLNPEMIRLGQQKATQQAIGNITWLVGKAEDLSLADAAHDLIVAGSSFHWMNQELLAQRAYRALTPAGAIVLTGGGSDVWEPRCEWHRVAVSVIQDHLGPQRRAGSGVYSGSDRHEDFLEPAGFTLESRTLEVQTTRDADSIVGFLYSTSYANPALFGDDQRRERFEADLRGELARLSPDGEFPETLEFVLMIGRKRM